MAITDDKGAAIPNVNVVPATTDWITATPCLLAPLSNRPILQARKTAPARIVTFRTNLFFIDTLGCSYQTGSLKFRDHPLTTLGTGAKPWPPVWITASENRTTGEIGILQDVSIGVLIDTTLFLFIDYQASRYVGSLSFDDPIACQKIYNLLKPNVGRSIEEIGDLELNP